MIAVQERRLNIKDIAVTEPKRDSGPIDPSAYFNSDDWKHIREHGLNSTKFGTSRFLLGVQVLRSDIFSTMKKVPESARDAAKYDVLRGLDAMWDMEPVNWPQFFAKAVDLKLMDPDRYRAINFEDRHFNEIFRVMERDIANPIHDQYKRFECAVSESLSLALLFPQHKEKIAKSQPIRNTVRHHFTQSVNDGELNGAISAAVTIRSVFPEEYELQKKYIDAMLKNVDNLEQHILLGNLEDNIVRAANLKILLAEKVRLTRNGISLQMQGDTIDIPPTPIPNRRRF